MTHGCDMDEDELKQGLNAARAYLSGPAGPRGNNYNFLEKLIYLALQNPSHPVRRADVLLALDKAANIPPSDYVRTDALLRTWEIVVRHCGSALTRKGGNCVQLHAETVSKVLRFTFVWTATTEAADDEGSTFVLEGGCLRYSEEVSTSSLSFHGRMRYWKPKINITKLAPRLLFLAPTLIYILIFLLVALLSAANLTLLAMRPNPAGVVTGALVLALAPLIYISRIAPAFRSKANRVSIVPERFTKVNAVPAVLEYLKDGDNRFVRIVNFTSSCVLCGGDVHLANGRHELKGRIVGECIESPLEHVYSFDRMTLEGVPLRAMPTVSPGHSTRISCDG